MKSLLVQLQFIFAYAKTIHYNFHGKNFLSVHKYMDKVVDDIDDYADEIREKYFMYNGFLNPPFDEIYEETSNKLKNVQNYTLSGLADAIRVLTHDIEELVKNDKTLDAGDTDLLGRLSSKFKTHYALLSHTE